MPPNSVAVAMLTWPSPPRTWPTSEPAKATMRLAMPPRTIRSPAIDEERDRQQREDAHAGVQPLEHDQRRQPHVEHGGEAGDAEAEGDRRADQHQQREDAEEDPELHRAQPSRCSSSTATSSAPLRPGRRRSDRRQGAARCAPARRGRSARRRRRAANSRSRPEMPSDGMVAFQVSRDELAAVPDHADAEGEDDEVGDHAQPRACRRRAGRRAARRSPCGSSRARRRRRRGR